MLIFTLGDTKYHKTSVELRRNRKAATELKTARAARFGISRAINIRPLLLRAISTHLCTALGKTRRPTARVRSAECASPRYRLVVIKRRFRGNLISRCHLISREYASQRERRSKDQRGRETDRWIERARCRRHVFGRALRNASGRTWPAACLRIAPICVSLSLSLPISLSLSLCPSHDMIFPRKQTARDTSGSSPRVEDQRVARAINERLRRILPRIFRGTV